MGRLDEAVVLLAEAERGVGTTAIYRAAARAARGWVLAKLGRLDEGAVEVRAALDNLLVAPSHHTQALSWLARIEVMRGRANEALDAATSALAALDRGASGAGESSVYVAVVEAERSTGEHAAAAASHARGRASVLERAERISETRYRSTFLAIPENVWLRRDPA
jgi:hypothetical protein